MGFFCVCVAQCDVASCNECHIFGGNKEGKVRTSCRCHTAKSLEEILANYNYYNTLIVYWIIFFISLSLFLSFSSCSCSSPGEKNILSIINLILLSRALRWFWQHRTTRDAKLHSNLTEIYKKMSVIWLHFHNANYKHTKTS